MIKDKPIKLKPKAFKLSINNIYKEFNGKKYRLQGKAPIEMKYDLERIYRKHGFDVETERADFNIINLWLRK